MFLFLCRLFDNLEDYIRHKKVKDKNSRHSDVVSKTQKHDSSVDTDNGFRDYSSGYDGDCEGDNPQHQGVLSRKCHVNCQNDVGNFDPLNMFNSKISVQQLTHGHPNGLTEVFPVVVDNPSKKQYSNGSASVNDIAVQNTSLPVSHTDDKESSNVSASVNDHNTSSHVSPMVDKKLPGSFPQSHGASDKNEHIHNKHSTIEDEHIHNTQFAVHPDENVSKTDSSTLDKECILGQFPDTKSDEDSDEELEIIVQDSEDEEIKLLVDQRDVDYSFLASLCERYACCGYQGVAIVAN